MLDDFLSDDYAHTLLMTMWAESMFMRGYQKAVHDPETRIEQSENNIDILVALPGLSRSDIKVTIEGGVLTVSTADLQVENGRWTSCGATCAWALPVGALLHQISSRYEAGVLTVSIPHETSKPLEIPVE